KNLEVQTQQKNEQDLEFASIRKALEEQSQKVSGHTEELEIFNETLTSLKNIMASNNSATLTASAQSHFTRGTNQEKLGHLEVAIDDYSQAIDRMKDYAEAYLRRGMAKSKLGRKQSAVIDLNLATKYFFESGDLGNYQRAKSIAANIHKINYNDGPADSVDLESEQHSHEEERKSELVSINGLFGG
ncbi:MAG: hypothetical protein AAGB01_11445, partial [Cyanobacteria bacterium P01_F01_bin.42]